MIARPDPGPFLVPKRLRYVVRRDGEVLSLASLGKTCNRTAPVLPKWRRTPCKSAQWLSSTTSAPV